MIHVLNVAFDFDDKKISEIIEKTAEEKVIENLSEKALESISEDYFGVRAAKEKALKKIVSDSVDQMMYKWKDEIIEAAASKLAEKLQRSKAAKELTCAKVEDKKGFV